MTLPTMPILPIDLFSRGTDMPLWDIFKHTTPDSFIHNYPDILDLKVNAKSGVYDVVGLTNWRGETVHESFLSQTSWGWTLAHAMLPSTTGARSCSGYSRIG